MKKTLLSSAVAIALFCCINYKTVAQTDWHVNGNSGTSPATNFIGTTDNKGLSIRTKNSEHIRVLPSGNVGIGTSSPKQVLDVNGNINIGTGAFLYMANHKVLRVDSAAGNIFLGNNAGDKNTTGNYNTGLGTGALYSNTAGYNTATGYKALYSNTTGSNNTANGWSALYNNTTGYGNTAVGIDALYSNVSGRYNTAGGDYALFNTFDSWGNTAFGDIAGASYNNGYYNTFIGAESDATAADIYNSTALGRGTLVSAASQVRIGNSFVTSIGGYADWSTISDGRVKKNIKDNVPGLAFINKLKAVTYNLDLDAADRLLQTSALKQKEKRSQSVAQADAVARNAKQQVVYTGFIAQDVERAATELNYDFSGVDAAKNDKDLYSLRYAEFVVPLVKAVQELSQKVEKLEAELAQKNAGNASAIMSKTVSITDADLSQNNPNPFSNTTTISYTLPQQYQSAGILVTGKSGNILKEIKVSGNGSQRLTLDASTLPAGAYQYALYVNGKLVGTKQMILAR